MPRMEILSAVEREEFDAPPTFTLAQQQRYLEPSLELIRRIKRLQSPTNQVCLLISYGYFLATHRFFSPLQFRKSDRRFVADLLGVSLHEIALSAYAKQTATRHRRLILTLCQFRLWNPAARRLLQAEAQTFAQLYWEPRKIFLRLVDWLVAARVTVPRSDTLGRLVAAALTRHQHTIAEQLGRYVTPSLQKNLMTLLAPPPRPERGAQYHLTQLKRLSQSTKPSKVRLRLDDLEYIRTLYHQVTLLRRQLALPEPGIIYFATLAMTLAPLNLLRRPEADRLLHLFAFVMHHYFRLQDNLVDVFLNVLPSLLNSVRREQMERWYATRETHSRSLHSLLTLLETTVLTAFNKIKQIAQSSTLSDHDKVHRIQRIFATQQTSPRDLTEVMTPLKASVDDTMKQEAYYTALERRSLRLQARLMPILKGLSWQGTDQALLAAIQYVQNRNGSIGPEAPRRFLTPAERKAISPPDQSFRVSLYKALLFVHVGQGLKAGTLYLEHSYKYRALEGYLLSRDQWQQRRAHYVHYTELEPLSNPRVVLQELEATLHQHYVTTNERLGAKQNSYVSQRPDTSLLVKTPAQSTVKTEALSGFFPGRQYIALSEILATVNQLTQFLTEFAHGPRSPQNTPPPLRTFLAGLLGLGCGIGIRKLARISRHVNEAQVEHAVNWYFTPATLRAANDRILHLLDHLPLPRIYQRSADALQTSSDGQKFEVPTESLNANYSYKYFGKGQGVSVYSFINERHLLFHSTVINAAERENTYVFDGLLHKNGPSSAQHSTDTHGYSELVFGVMALLGLTYAPRIKNFLRQRLYAFKRLRHHEAYATFTVKPYATINTALIESQWEEILRFVASLKLQVTTPSAVFRRLNSYSSQHVLYRALKAFGQIHKSIFLLRYLDEVELRQQVTQQLNKVEQSHRFARALSVGNPREFLSVEKEAQEVEEGCRRLIKNAVTCWNYVYLSKRLLHTTDRTHQQLFLEAIRHGSPISWQHVNLLGEYDFSDQRLEDSVGILPATWLKEKKGTLAEIIR